MNIQIPFDLLGDYEYIAVSTDVSFYQLTVRYQNVNIGITLNDHEIESYHFGLKKSTVEGKRRVRQVLLLLIGYFEKLGYKDVYNRFDEVLAFTR